MTVRSVHALMPGALSQIPIAVSIGYRFILAKANS